MRAYLDGRLDASEASRPADRHFEGLCFGDWTAIEVIYAQDKGVISTTKTLGVVVDYCVDCVVVEMERWQRRCK